MKPQHIIGVTFWSCSKPAAMIAALQMATATVQVLNESSNVIAQVGPLAALSKIAIPAGTRCETYVTLFQGASVKAQIPANVYGDLNALTQFVGQVVKTCAFNGDQQALKANLESAFVTMTEGLKVLIFATQRISAKGPFAQRPQTPAKPVNLMFVAAFGVPSGQIQSTVQQMFAGAVLAAQTTQMQNTGFAEEIVLGEEGSEVTLQFRSTEQIGRFGNVTTLCQQFVEEIAGFEGQFEQVEGAENFGVNPHQFTLQFPEAKLAITVTATKPFDTYGDVKQFFGHLKGLLIQQIQQSPEATNIDPTTQPFALQAWGNPVLTNGSKVTTASLMATA